MASIHTKWEETELPLGPQSEVEMNLGVTGECLSSAHSVLANPQEAPVRCKSRAAKLEFM